MKHTLTLTGSTAALAAAMKAFDEASEQQGNAGSTPTGTGTADAPASPPPAPTPAAPTPSAPTPPTAPNSTSPSDDEEDGDDSDGTGLDSNGLPWDERIHSSSKKKGKDGTWNKRRGGPSGDELTAIENELRGGGGEPEQQQQSAPAPSAPPPMPPAMPAATATPAPPPPMPPMPSSTPTPAPAPAEAAEQADDMDFASLMGQIGPKLGEGEGQINQEYLAGLCQKQGINSITDLAVKPELIGPVVAQLKSDGRW